MLATEDTKTKLPPQRAQRESLRAKAEAYGEAVGKGAVTLQIGNVDS
jgi:hypothetical protein